MTSRIKAAALSLFVIASMTGLKFILYYLSGSIAVLSEAWHSFSDIATTLLVLVAILRRQRKSAFAAADDAPPAFGRHRRSFSNRLSRWFSRVDPELKIAGFISLVLLGVSVLILWRAIFAAAVTVEMPFVTGVIFIGLSFGSFFLYRFQETMGREADSAALKADSLHNRADMAISLLTGASLILYHFGYSVDRWVGVYIALFIFSFAVEMLVNVLASAGRGGSGLTADYRFNDIGRAALRPETYTRIINAAIRHVPLSKKRQALARQLPAFCFSIFRRLVFGAVIALGLATLGSMFYTVATEEQALVLRFGHMVHPDQAVGPGLHWKMPWPVDRVYRIQTRRLHSLTVGNTADANTPMIWHFDHGDTTTYISGDNNLFLPYLIIHYRIKNPWAHFSHYRSGAADRLLEYQANHILTRVFATTAYYEIALFDRRQWTAAAESDLQRRLDDMHAGIEIVSFCLRDLHPPKEIAASYENVVAAHQNREERLNEAERYYDTKLPSTRAVAHETVTGAHSRAEARVKLAAGEAQSYRTRLSQFRKSGDLGKTFLSHRAAVKNLKGRDLVLVDPKSGIDTRLLYVENYLYKGENSW